MYTRRLFSVIFVLAATVVSVHGFSLSVYRWPTAAVLYYVNPSSIYVSAAAVTSAVQTAAKSWNDQSQANIELVYAGTTTGSVLKLNYRNEVFLRNTSSGSYIAKTYTYWNGSGQRIDSDIIFYEGAYRYYAFSGCSKGVYVESAATHEFGHLLGVQHSSVSGATMVPTMPTYCDRTWLTLEADDRAAIERAYPPLLGVRAPMESQTPLARRDAAVGAH
jgi:hypothetical protein